MKDVESIPEKGLEEDSGDGFYFGDYIVEGGRGFFNSKISYTLFILSREAQDKQFHSKDIPKYCIESMLYLLKVCKENPIMMLSGKYPIGDAMMQVAVE